MRISRAPIRTALIGVSGYGGTHLITLNKLVASGQIKLSAATVINHADVPDKCEELKKLNCRIYADYRHMLEAEAGQVDLCCVPTGIAWHGEMTQAALATGCHVLVEKPAAGTVQEVDEMIRARDRANRMVAVGFQQLYHEDYARLKSRVLQGEIGRLREIRVKGSWPRSAGYYIRNDWAGRLKAGRRWVLDSPANNAFAHFLMGALHLAGESASDVANPLELEAELYRTQEIETFDTIVARVSTDTAVEIVFAVTHSSPHKQDPILDLRGDRGTIRWEVDQSMTIDVAGKAPERVRLMSAAEARDRMYTRVLEQIRGTAPEACRPEEARKHTVLINAIHEAIPIHSVASRYCGVCPGEVGDQHFIHGINEAIQQTFESGLLFSELNLPWAVPSTRTVIDCQRYFREPFINAPVLLPTLAEAAPRLLSDDFA